MRAMELDRDILHILLLEDNTDDAELIHNELILAGLRARVEHVEDRESFMRALDNNPDVILSDFSLPSFDAISALEIVRSRNELTPFIIVSGVLTDEAASQAIRRGAWDYLLKDRLGRLASSIQQALHEREMRREREEAKNRLEDVHRRLESAFSQLQVAHDQLEDAYEQLKANQAQLVQAEKMSSLGQLVAGIAHEINNPVGFVRSNLERLADYSGVFTSLLDAYERVEEQLLNAGPAAAADPENLFAEVRRLRHERKVNFMREDIHVLLAESCTGVEQIMEIVQGLRDFSRIDEPDFQTANVNDGIEATLRLIWNELKYRFEVRTELGELPLIHCHPGQINQVFMNLLLNAVQATPDRGVITIQTEADEESVIVRISDSGQGIEPDELTKIFEPFFTTKPVGEGTGLGLSISYGIIKRHNGQISVESQPGVGTTFTIRLPIRQSHE